jgi:ATP-binding cassette subfamily C (CFTR/MRP) protein 1
MSADVERTATGLRFMHECWASCINIGHGIYLLERQFGPASAVPGVLFLFCSVVGLQVAASMGQRQRLWLEGIEKRIKATSDALAAVKEVKMGGLQVVMEKKLRELRQEEMKASRKFKNALALITCLSCTTAAMGPVLSFGIYSLLAKRNNTTPVTSEIGFTALSIFSLHRTPMALILDAISGLVAAIGAIQRI